MFTFSTELKIWSFQVVVVQEGREIYRLAWCICREVVLLTQIITFLTLCRFGLGAQASLVPSGVRERWSRQEIVAGATTNLFYFSRGLAARSRALSRLHHLRARDLHISLFAPLAPSPHPPNNRHLLRRLQLCRRLRKLDQLGLKQGRACRSIPGAKCGICVS